jgi:hypothetical protein
MEGLTILGDSHELLDSVQRKFGGDDGPRYSQCSRGDRQPQDHLLSVRDKSKTGSVQRSTDREQRKATSEQWMCWIADFNLCPVLFLWVVE